MSLFGCGLSHDRNWPNVALRVIAYRDACHHTSINQSALESRIRLRKDVREDISRIRRGVILSNRRSVPADINYHVLNRLSNDGAFVFRHRRMLNNWKFNKKIFLATSPIAEKLLNQLE